MSLCSLLGITESNLARRREFIHLGQEERAILAALLDRKSVV